MSLLPLEVFECLELFLSNCENSTLSQLTRKLIWISVEISHATERVLRPSRQLEKTDRQHGLTAVLLSYFKAKEKLIIHLL